MANRTLTRSVDGRLVESYLVGNGLYRILIDGELQPDLFTRDEIRAIITGRYRLVLDSESTLDPSDNYMDHGHQGIVFHRGDGSDTVTKVVFLPRDDQSLVSQRRMERSNGLDSWRSFYGSSILSSNRHQADLFSRLSREPGPASLPRIMEYREGPLDADSRRRLVSSGFTDEQIPPVGWPTAVWVMERLTPARFDDDDTDRSRRQALDYLWQEHRMVVRDIGGDSGNWGIRDDGTPVLIDPLVVDVSPVFPDELPTTHAAFIRRLRNLRRSDPALLVRLAAPFGVTIDDGCDSLGLSLLGISLAYRSSDYPFSAFIDDYRMGRPNPHDTTYLGYPHRRKPFM